MENYRSIILCLLLSIACALGQPFTQSGLEWPNRRAQVVAPPPSCPTVATNSLTSLAENSTVTVPLFGSGGGYSINDSPTHGSLSGLDGTHGSVSYTPNTDYVGADAFTFLVTSNSCVATGRVYLLIFDTNTVSGTATNPVCTTVAELGGGTATTCVQYTSNGVPLPPVCSTNAGGWSGFSGTVCAVMAPTNYCGDAYSDNIAFVHWTSGNLGTAVTLNFQDKGNGVVAFSSRQGSVGQGGMAMSYFICGGPTNRTVSVDGVVTNTFQNISDNAVAAYGFTTQQTIPFSFSQPVVTTIHFTYTLTAQTLNNPEIEMLMNKNSSDGGLHNNTFSGLLTNTIH
jgi:hypothetical protein